VLRQAINSWNQDQIYEHFRQSDIQWNFNPPTASHVGRAWERMIRSVRRVLSTLTNDRVLTDDQLETFLLGAESVVNPRPLTPVTMDTDGETPLTPNSKLSSSSQRKRRSPANKHRRRRQLRPTRLAPCAISGRSILEEVCERLFANCHCSSEVVPKGAQPCSGRHCDCY